MIFEGGLSVKALLKYHRRHLDRIVIDEAKKDKDTAYIIHQAQENNVPVERLTREKIDELCTGKTHGGIIAEAGERTYQEIDELINGNGFVCIIEGIEDPFNLGYALRTLYSAGCDGVIINKRDWNRVSPVIVKASAGASEGINIMMSDKMQETIAYFKQHEYTCYAAMRKDAVSYDSVDYTKKTLIAIGGEMRGLSKDVLENVDQNIYIPYANDFRNALNASSAIAVLAYEVVRQRK